MKSLAEIRELKAHIHQELRDDHAPDPNYVIVGGGPTGIELAGALPEYLRHVMTKHGIKHRALHIDLVEMAPHLMPRLPKDVGQSIANRLRSLGVRLYLGKAVQGETADALMIEGQPLETQTVIWTAGVTNHPFFHKNGFTLTDKGKVTVDQFLQAEPDIFVLGDNADTPYSGMAQTALYDAVFAAHNLIRVADGGGMRRYHAVEPVYVTPTGPHWAALYWRKIRVYGRLGSWLRSMANWVAYHDFEPWWRASKEWLTEFETEEDCPVCAKAKSTS
jgi:NADH dehydrogenase